MNASKRALWALACLLIGVGPAAAATYYVSPAGSGTACTESQPCALSYVNPRVAAGDVVRLAAGTYSGTSIAPAVSGANASPAGMISYVGSVTNPAGTIIPSLAISQSFISIKGVKVSTTGAPEILGSDNVLEDCVINASRFSVAGPGTALNPPVKAARNIFRDISFNLYKTTDLNTNTLFFRGMENSRFDSCRFVITHPPNVTGGSFLKFFYSPNNRFVDCGWNMISAVTADCDECTWVVFRDNSAHNAFVRDTFTMTAPAGATDPTVFYAAVAGNAGNEGGVHGLKFDSCVMRATNPFSLGLLVFQDPMDTDTLVNCTIVTPTGAAVFASKVNNSVIDHCTFVSLDPSGAVFKVNDNALWTGATTITNSIFHSNAAAATESPGWQRNAPTHVSANYNLFYSSAGAAKAVDYGWQDWHSVSATCLQHSTECASLFGNPLFVGGAGALTYDTHLTSGSPARGKASGGSDIGALPFGGGGGDLTPPGVVSNLTAPFVASTSVTLGWTAPGDDGFSGTLTTYDLRWSSLPITAANFSSATPMAPQPAVVTGGTAQTYLVTSLTPGMTYYFALKAADEAGNWSGMSNVAVALTPAADLVRPGPINDLRAP